MVYRVLLAGLPKAGADAKQLVPLGVCAGEVGDWTPGASGVDGAVEEAASRVCPGHVPCQSLSTRLGRSLMQRAS